MTRAAWRLFIVPLVVLVSAVPVPAGQQGTTRTVTVDGSGSYTALNPAALAAMLARKDFLLVNVHVPYEGEIERTNRVVPFDAIEARLDTLRVRKDAKMVLYCRSWNLEGGMIAWEGSGYALTHRRR